MSKIITYPKNILETGTVSATPSANASFPIYRLYDRALGRLFKFGSVVNPSIVHVDQGASYIEIDTLIIATGHNLDGLTLTLQWAEDDSNWTTHLSWTQSGNSQIEKALTAVTKRYWRLSIANPLAVPQIGEMFLTKKYEWERNPEELDREIHPKFNVQRYEDKAGRPRFYEAGDEKRYRGYTLYKIYGTHRTAVEALNDVWAGGNPFWMKDTDGTLIFGELIEPLNITRSGDFADTPFKFLEVIA